MNKQLQAQALSTLYDSVWDLALVVDNKDWSLVEKSLKKVRGFIQEHQKGGRK